jgi:hypothetical protein
VVAPGISALHGPDQKFFELFGLSQQIIIFVGLNK